MRRVREIAVLSLCVLLLGSTAGAQVLVDPDRGYLQLNLGFQPTSSDVERVVSVPVYDELAVLAGRQEVSTGLVFDLGGAWALSERFFVGAMYSRSAGDDTAQIVGLIPHPVIVDNPRTVAFEADEIGHTEQALHFSAIWRFNPGANLQFSGFGGPSVIFASHELANEVTLVETGPPYTDVGVDVAFAESDKTAFGFHVGGEVTYRFGQRLGVTGTARYVYGSADFPAAGDQPDIEIDLGGFQTLVGLRWFF
jgi:hypothetical protein